MTDEFGFGPESGASGDAEAAFGDRLGAALRGAEVGDAGFEERVMAAVRQEQGAPLVLVPTHAPAGERSWWRRRHTFTVAPLAGLAAAAGFAIAVSLGTLAAARAIAPAPAPVVAAANQSGDQTGPQVHTVASTAGTHSVNFVLVARDARSVSLVGDFNGWARGATHLERHADGVWSISVPLPPGRYEYAFIVDGKRWTVDPYAPTVIDDFGTRSSVVTLGASCTAAS